MSERAKGKSGGIYFKVTDEERKLIEQRMALMGVRNMSAYIRKMCIDGYIVQQCESDCPPGQLRRRCLPR